MPTIPLRQKTVSTPESHRRRILESLRGSNSRIALVVTGGGSGALSQCFRRSGASDNFIEAAIPYSRAALTEYLGCQPSGSSASAATAKQLASVALRRAARLGDGEGDARVPTGIALAAALPTTPKRRGSDRIHVAMRVQNRGVLLSVELAKETHDRESAERVADELVFCVLAELCGQPMEVALQRQLGEALTREEFHA